MEMGEIKGAKVFRIRVLSNIRKNNNYNYWNII